MKTLWIFGDSFSTGFDYNNLHVNQKNYMTIMNINNFKIWPDVLGEKLNCEVKNFAKGGNSNYEIFQDKRDRWAGEVYLWERAIRTLSKHKNFKAFFWTAEEPRLIYNLNEEEKKDKNYLCSESNEMLLSYLNKMGCTSMSDETGGIVSDSHMGLQGHIKQAEIFYNTIING